MNQILGDGTGERIPPPPPSFLLQVDFPVCIHSLKKLDSTFLLEVTLRLSLFVIHGHMLMIATQV